MKAAEHQPETISVVCYGGIYYKVWYVRDANTIVPTHSHEYDHLTALLSGVVEVSRDNEPPNTYKAPATIEIPAGTKHAFRTRMPHCVFACIHNADRLEDGEPAVRDEHHLVDEEG